MTLTTSTRSRSISAGNLVLSMRNTSALYDIDHQTGQVLWSLGGKSSTFKMGKGTSTWGQHDAVVEPDGSLTLFDDGAGPPKVHPYSRGIRERLDTKRRDRDAGQGVRPLTPDLD